MNKTFKIMHRGLGDILICGGTRSPDSSHKTMKKITANPSKTLYGVLEAGG